MGMDDEEVPEEPLSNPSNVSALAPHSLHQHIATPPVGTLRPSKSAIEALLAGYGDEEAYTEETPPNIQVSALPTSAPLENTLPSMPPTKLFQKATRAPLHTIRPHVPNIVSTHVSTSPVDGLDSVMTQPELSAPAQSHLPAAPTTAGSLFQVASKAFVPPSPAHQDDSPPGLEPLPEPIEDKDDNFEAILAAARAKKSQMPVRQLHKPTPPPTKPSASSSSSSLFSSARTIREEEERAAVPSLHESAPNKDESFAPPKHREEDEEDDFEKMMANIKAKNGPRTFNAPTRTPATATRVNHLGAPSAAPPSSSLFQSARSIPSSDMESQSETLSAPTTSLFQTAAREVNSPSSSLFASARSINSESNPARAPASSSLFSSASSLRDESGGHGATSSGSLFQTASAQRPSPAPSTSLFSSARSIHRGEEVGDGPVAPSRALSETAPQTSSGDDDADFDRYLASLSTKKSAPAFAAPRSLTAPASSSIAPSHSSSLFQPAARLSDSPNGLQNGTLSSSSASGAPTGEEADEFEAFLKTVSKRTGGGPAPIVMSSAKKTTSSPSVPARAKTTASPVSTTAAANPRKFKAPAMISSPANRNSSSKVDETAKTGDDDLQDALLSLLEDDSDDDLPEPSPEASTPSNSFPKSPTILNRPKKVAAPVIAPIPLEADISEGPIPSVASPLPTENFTDLLDGIEYEELGFTPQSTPQRVAPKNRFYSSPSSKTPATPSPSTPALRPGISSRGVVRSSPYSLTSPNAMPIVVSTPNKHIEVRSPTRLPRSASPVIASVAPSQRARAPFTSPTKVNDEDGETDESLAKRSKQVVYGRSAAHASDSAQKKEAPLPSNQLFNLQPSEEQLAARKPWSELGRVPHGFARHQLMAYKIRPDIVDMTSDSAKTFKFSQMDSEGSLKQLGAEEMFQVLLSEGASRKVLTLPWVENHFRWIVWKLGSVERSFPQEFANAYLTPERVLAQLKYRYERELNCAKRPPLRKILEHDAPAGVHIVLVVTAVRHDGTADKSVRVTGDDGPQTYDEADEANRIIKGPLAILEVSDGWYGVHALCDTYLTRQVQNGAIFAGQKLHVFGASIIGNDNPTPPLEITASTMLKLSINGVRRAKWDEKLGFNRIALPSLRLSSLKPGGGNAPKIDAIILRVYPLTFSEEVIITPVEDEANKNADGEANPVMRVTRTPYGEDMALERFMKRKEDWIEKKVRELTIEILEESKTNASKPSNRMDVDEAANGDAKDEVKHYYDESYLTTSQREKLDERLREAMEVEPWLDRQVTPILKMLICDYPGSKGTAYDVIEYLRENGVDGLMTLTAAQNKALHSLGKAILTVYNVTEDALARFKEGTRIQASFISYKGEPVLPLRPSPSAPFGSQANNNPNGFSNFASADDPFSLSDTITEVAVAPLPRLSTTVYTVFNFPTTTAARSDANPSSMMESRLPRGDSIVKTLNSLFGRVATPFDALDSRLKLRDFPAPENNFDLDANLDYERRRLVDRFTIANEFDGVGVVVYAGKKELVKKCRLAVEEELNAMKDEYVFDVFLGDQSGNILSLRAETILDNLPPTAFDVGSILCFKNVLYEGLDTHLGVHTAASTPATEWITKAPSATANPSLKSRRDMLIEWTQTNEFVETMELLSSRIMDIRTSRASKAVPNASSANAIFNKT